MKSNFQLLESQRTKHIVLLLPLFLLPFVTMFFWALGGGNTHNRNSILSLKKTGINLTLPEAQLKNDTDSTKFSFYQRAALDSQLIFKERKLDPYWSTKNSFKESKNDIANFNNPINSYKPIRKSHDYSAQVNTIPAEDQIYKKVAEINRLLDKSKAAADSSSFYGSRSPTGDVPNLHSEEIDRLEKLINTTKDKEKDPEIEQLNTMLDKILLLNHYERSDSVEIRQNKQPTYGARINSRSTITFFDSTTESICNDSSYGKSVNQFDYDFFSVGSTAVNNDNNKKRISAVIPETQIVTPGCTVKLMLKEEIVIDNIFIPKNSYIYGVARLNNERLRIDISSIPVDDDILPVSIEVFDLDGISGIHIPNSINRDILKGSTDQLINSAGAGATVYNPSVAAQVAGVGIEAVKSVLGKKTKPLKIVIPEGYQLILKQKQ